MPIDLLTLLVIVSMAGITYATRAGGLWFASRLPASRRVTDWLRRLPGCVLCALLAPALWTGRLTEPLAAVVTVLVAAWGGNLLLAMLAGVLVVWGTRLLGG